MRSRAQQLKQGVLTLLRTTPNICNSEQVTNAGNVDILGLSVTDPSVTLSCSPPLTTSPGDQFSCTGSYSLTWLEIIAGGTTATGT